MFSFIKSFMNRPHIRNRRHQRLACEQPAALEIPDRRITLNGMIIEISRAGALFREASRFILDRRREKVILRVAGFELAGTIVNVRNVGYGILLDQDLDDDQVARIVDGRILTAA
jgi:hypothetical protein